MHPALLLDRDGIVNIDHDYVHKVEQCDFMDGIFELAKAAVDKGYLIFVITNQAGIGRGYYSEEQFAELTTYIEGEFQKHGSSISKTYFCPNHPEFGIGKYKVDCNFRKPAPGMILQAKQEFGLDLKSSIIIGDRESDIEAGINAGITKKILFPHKNHVLNNGGITQADVIIKNLNEAIKYL